ncbi:MAG TPA: hypothetical protein P5210_07035 [Draconibacterium sp.]|nr:hypothetical protein [Draconibacterium sp.]HRX11383.1 hypothetical protein [Draconibacterium sp.]
MQAFIGNTEPSNIIGMEKILFENQQVAEEVKIIEYAEDTEKGQLLISLYSQLFSESQLKISIRESKIVIIVTELVGFGNSSTTYISDWQTYSQKSYLRMRNISLLLPGDNFYLLRHIVVPEKFLLNIILGKLIGN